MHKLLNRSQIWGGLAACILLAGAFMSGGAVKPALAQACDKVGGRLGGAVIGGATGSLFYKKGRRRRAAALGGAIVGGALGASRDRRARARCLEEREVSKNRDVQRQLDYDRQRLLQHEHVRIEIEEQRLYDEWKRRRLGSSN